MLLFCYKSFFLNNKVTLIFIWFVALDRLRIICLPTVENPKLILQTETWQ